MTRRVSPMPAVAAGAGPFLVNHCAVREGGQTAPPSKGRPGLFVVPLDPAGVESLALRQHEYGHLGIELRRILPRYTKRALQLNRIGEDWIQSGLDVIVNGYMVALGNDEIVWLRPWTGRASADRSIAAMNYIRCEGMRVAREGRDQLTQSAGLSGQDRALLDRASATLWSLGRDARPISINVLVHLLGELQRVFGPDSLESRAQRRPFVPHGLDAQGDYVEPGDMEVVRPALAPHGRSRHAGRSFRPAYTGTFRYPHRALVPGADGRAFGIRRRAYGGAILIDCSGSMSLQRGDIERVLAVAPGATVAVYAGLPNDSQSGRLVIVASHERVADLSPLGLWLGAGNVVDVPALEWLSRQRAPRVWISDGAVSGVRDKPGENLKREVAEIVRAGRIRRLLNIPAYLASPQKRR